MLKRIMRTQSATTALFSVTFTSLFVPFRALSQSSSTAAKQLKAVTKDNSNPRKRGRSRTGGVASKRAKQPAQPLRQEALNQQQQEEPVEVNVPHRPAPPAATQPKAVTKEDYESGLRFDWNTLTSVQLYQPPTSEAGAPSVKYPTRDWDYPDRCLLSQWLEARNKHFVHNDPKFRQWAWKQKERAEPVLRRVAEQTARAVQNKNLPDYDSALYGELEWIPEQATLRQFLAHTGSQVLTHYRIAQYFVHCLNDRRPLVSLRNRVNLTELVLDTTKVRLVAGESGGGKTERSISAAHDFVGDNGLVIYAMLHHETSEYFYAKEIEKKRSKVLESRSKNDSGVSMDNDLFLKVLEKIIRSENGSPLLWTRLQKEGPLLTEPVRLAIVLDELGPWPGVVRAACSFFNGTSPNELGVRLGFGPMVQVALVLCGSGVTRCLEEHDPLPQSYCVTVMPHRSGLWEKLLLDRPSDRPRLERAYRSSLSVRLMANNPRMCMLIAEQLVACDTKQVRAADPFAVAVAKRFQSMNALHRLTTVAAQRDELHEALRCVVWDSFDHKAGSHPLKGGSIISSYGLLWWTSTIQTYA